MTDADGNEIRIGDKIVHAVYPSTAWTVTKIVDHGLEYTHHRYFTFYVESKERGKHMFTDPKDYRRVHE